MGDIDIETYGCVAIAPLWLGGLARRNTLSVLHSCEGIKGAKKPDSCMVCCVLDRCRICASPPAAADETALVRPPLPLM
eukprot:scaffold4665_cov33-Tisochrysis_lutea.AAC.2